MINANNVWGLLNASEKSGVANRYNNRYPKRHSLEWPAQLACCPVSPFRHIARPCPEYRSKLDVDCKKMRSKAKNATRLVLYVGLLCLELGLVLNFYIFSQFESQNAPDGHWQMETPFQNASTPLWIGLIALLGLVLLGNAALVSSIWREVKNLRANDS